MKASGDMTVEHVDVIIVGAGLSGVGAGVHLGQKCPDTSYLILEGRSAMGGTWDLFRYPGIRSDSDMHTLGYSFKPWLDAKAIADGPAILDYVKETAAESGVDNHIRYNHLVKRASWSTSDAKWTIEAERNDTGAMVRFTCNFLFMNAGYYSYREGFTPQFKDIERFKGQLVHPQKWPDDLDYKGKKVVVIGSGATAMTLVPAMANDVAHIVMLQRSPTYVVSRPDKDSIANALRTFLPESWAYAVTRWKNVTLQQYMYRRTRTQPAKVKKALVDMVQKELGPEYDVATHFTPRYNPWDQRLCLVPNSDLFEAIRSGKASVVTDHIDAFVENGIRLKSGSVLEADIIVTATGLNLVVLGEMHRRIARHERIRIEIRRHLSRRTVFVEANDALIAVRRRRRHEDVVLHVAGEILAGVAHPGRERGRIVQHDVELLPLERARVVVQISNQLFGNFPFEHAGARLVAIEQCHPMAARAIAYSTCSGPVKPVPPRIRMLSEAFARPTSFALEAPQVRRRATIGVRDQVRRRVRRTS